MLTSASRRHMAHAVAPPHGATNNATLWATKTKAIGVDQLYVMYGTIFTYKFKFWIENGWISGTQTCIL